MGFSRTCIVLLGEADMHDSDTTTGFIFSLILMITKNKTRYTTIIPTLLEKLDFKSVLMAMSRRFSTVVNANVVKCISYFTTVMGTVLVCAKYYNVSSITVLKSTDKFAI